MSFFQEEIDPQTQSAPKGSAPLNILVVEDDAAWQSLLEKVINKIDPNTNLSFATNAKTALDTIQSDPLFDFIISDQNLDGLGTGLDIWDELLAEQCETPFILLAGHSKKDFISSLYPYRKEMIPQYFEKPGTVSELKSLLSEILTHSTVNKATHEQKNKINKKKYYWMMAITLFAIQPISINNDFYHHDTKNSLTQLYHTKTMPYLEILPPPQKIEFLNRANYKLIDFNQLTKK